MFISQDPATARATANEVVAMRDGRVVEQGPKADMFRPAHHAHTDLPVSSVPRMGRGRLSHPLAERAAVNIGDAAAGKA